MKYLLTLCCLPLLFSLNAQNLVSVTFLGQKTKAELLQEFNNLPFIQFGAKYYQVAYTTMSVQGVPDTATGLLAIPDQAGRIYPRLVYQHGTSGSKQDVPSVNVLSGGEGIVGRLFAGLGYVAFLPDYLGLGPKSKGFHPYVHAESEAWAATDMLRASATWLEQEQVATNDQLFITGYSQGGHGAMALHRAVEQDPDQEFTVTAAAPMSGPYSISGVMRDLILNDTVYYYPAYIPNTALSYQTVYGNLFNDLTDIFKPEYAGLIGQFYNNTISLSELNGLLISALTANEGDSRPFRMLQPALVQAVQTNPAHPINLALNDNDTYDNGWLPEAPFRLFYCMGDDQVPFRNSLLARDSFLAKGVSNFLIQDVLPTGDHGECYVPAMTGTIIFFLGLQQIGTVGTTAPENRFQISIAPNPADQYISISGITHPGRYDILDYYGKTVQFGNISGGDQIILLQSLPAGVYLFRVETSGGWTTGKVVVR